MTSPADNTGRCKVCGLALQVRGCTPGDCRTRPKGTAMVEMYARPPSGATAVAPADKPRAHPLPWRWSDAANKLTWLKDNCVSLSIEINEHKAIYMTVAEFFADDAEKGMDRFGDDDLDPNVRAACIEKNALCVLQVYPDTPVGFLSFTHHDVEAAIAEAYTQIRKERGIE